MAMLLLGVGMGAGAVLCAYLVELVIWLVVLTRKLTQRAPRVLFGEVYQRYRRIQIPAPHALWYAARDVVAIP